MDLFEPVELIRNYRGMILESSYPELSELARMAGEDGFTWPGYERTIEIAEQLSPHVFATKPVNLIGKQRPNEPDDVLEYRVNVWEPETKAFFGRFFNVVSRMGAPTAFSITHPPAPAVIRDDTLEAYTGEAYGDFDSIHAFTFEVLHEWLYGDPNAVLCVYDPHPEEDDSTFPNPQPFIYPSDKIIWKRERKEYLILTDFNSKVFTGEKPVMEGLVYLYIDRTSIYFLKQIGARKDWNFEVIKWQDHHLPTDIGTPAVTLGGDLKAKGSKKWYESFIQPAVADWNKFVIRTSDLDGWFVRTLYPQQVIAAADCEVCRNSGRKGYEKDRDGEWEICRGCKGTGQSLIGFGPFASIHVDPNKTDMKPSEAVAYASVDTGLYDPAQKNLDNHERKGFAALNMEMLSTTGTNQSGVAKDIDRKPLEDFLMRIAKRVFFLLGWQYKVVAYERYGGMMEAQPNLGREFVADMLPDVNPPHSLSYITLGMLFDELQKSSTSGAHSSILRAENKEISAKKYGPESAQHARNVAEIDLDPYYGWGADDLLAAGADGATNPLWRFIHTNIKILVDLAIEEEPEFLSMTPAEQRAILFPIAETVKAESTPEPVPIQPIPPAE